MKLVGFVKTKFFKNDFFKDVLKVVAKTPLSDSEVAIFGVVLELLQKKCIQEGIEKEDLGYVNVIISDDGSYAFEADENDEEAYGHYTQKYHISNEQYQKKTGSKIYGNGIYGRVGSFYMA